MPTTLQELAIKIKDATITVTSAMLTNVWTDIEY